MAMPNDLVLVRHGESEVRRARPVQDADGTWRVEVDPWRKLDFRTYSNDDLRAQVDSVPSLLG